ncbi:hypothetical protein TNCV_3897431 [Trichonephila clavipes]|nr:hypothetical protein TNCV_3897431 [Trichonephila clavipes]
MEFRHPDSPSVKNFKTLMTATKVIVPIFWDASSVLYTEFLTKGLTVNFNRGTVQHYNQSNNASAESDWKETSFFCTMTISDLAPPDFWLFPKLKETLKGQRFSTYAEVRAAVRKWKRS